MTDDARNSEWLTPEQFGARHGLSAQVVRRWCRKGSIACIRPGDGKLYLVRADAFDEKYQRAAR